ncbi:hypothetical protein [Carboxylicivirga marina]|uniref:hypothetical protein n=1 Tax=Carboxylicivirga marina TaxID=2800988 RepID=UPI002591AF9D|nr:hypothetical protein [uncultured Carboxylicivirga sp.]
MTNRFLQAKHWQIFLLTFGIPMIFQFVMMGSMMSNFTTQTNPDPTTMFNYMKFFPLMMVIFMAVFFGWFWSVAIGLQEKVPEGVTMKVRKFKIFFFIPLMYILLFMTFFSVSMNGLLTSNTVPNIGIIGGLFAIIFPLHLFSMFCIFYCLYFVAKTFKTVELQREVKFSDFAGEFFMIWFYPIGIWIVQPKINKMIEE